jgi:lipopolysaccharide transport system permease protein
MFSKTIPFASDLWKHRSLLWQFTLRNVELRHKGSHLGLVWSCLNPLLMLGLYVLMFGYVMGSKFGVTANETRADYGLGIFLGLTIFQFVAEVLGISPTIIVGNPNFVKKVVFPLEILPPANVGSALVHMLISLTLVMIGLFAFGHTTLMGVVWLPAILLPVVLLMLGVSWIFSALGVFFRDIGQVIGFLTMALMFSSGVFNSAASFKAAWTYLRFNPILLAIELARDAALWSRPLNPKHLAYLYLTGLVSCYLGHLAFRRMKPVFADVL